jgi:hypothetical protein
MLVIVVVFLSAVLGHPVTEDSKKNFLIELSIEILKYRMLKFQLNPFRRPSGDRNYAKDAECIIYPRNNLFGIVP